MAKVKLECTATHGRWNKGDVASFEKETATGLTDGKKPKWKKAPAEKKAASANKAAANTGATGGGS